MRSPALQPGEGTAVWHPYGVLDVRNVIHEDPPTEQVND